MQSTRSTPNQARRRPRRGPAAPAALGLLWLGLLATGGLTAGIGVRLRAVLVAGLSGAGVDRLVETGVLAAGFTLAAWLTLSVVVATLCATGRTAGVTWRAGERLVAGWAPAAVRRALVIAIGAGIGLSAATGAQASAPGDVDLGWVATAATTTASTTPTGSAEGSPAPTLVPPTVIPPTARPDTGAGTVVVEAGDSLWRVAQRSLPTGAGVADIASAWPAWYAANADAIGDDPGLLQPGQVLHAPTTNPTDGA